MEQKQTLITVTFPLPREKLDKLDEAARAGHRSRNKQVQRYVEQCLAQAPDSSHE